MDIMKHVDVLDLIKINVYRPNIFKPTEFQVDLECLEKDKQVVVDEDELQTLNRILTEKCREFEDARDPRVVGYIEEFVGKMCQEWHTAGLLVIEEIKDTPKDPYKEAKESV